MNPRLRSAAPCALTVIVLVVFATVLAGCLQAASPVSSADYAPRSGLAPLAVSFSVNASDPATSVTWDFGDGATASGNQVEHVFANPGEYTAVARWTLPSGASGASGGLNVSVYDPANLPGNYSVGNLTPADRLYLSTLSQKVALFDQYYVEFTYLNKSHGTQMRYTSRDFQFNMKQSLAQLDTIPASPELAPVRESARILFTNASDGAHAEFLAGINLEKGETETADSYLAEAGPKMAVAKAERDRLAPLIEVFG